MKIVEIEWVDSGGMTPIWESTEGLEPLKPLPIVSVGYLWAAKKKSVVICQSLSAGQVARRFVIPRGCIKKIRTVAKG